MENILNSFGANQVLEVVTLPKEVESEECNISKDIIENKQVRQDSTLEQMKQDLLNHSEESEKQLQSEVQLIREEMQLFKKSLENKHDSLCLTLNSEDEWIKVLDSVPEQDANSQKTISEFTEDLHSMEKNRVDKIKSILRKYRKEMNTIAYLSPENIEALFKEELEAVNKTVIDNIEKHSDIILALNGLRMNIIEWYKGKMKKSFQMWMENFKNSIIASFRQSESMEESIAHWSEIISEDESSSDTLKQSLETVAVMIIEIDNMLECFEKPLFEEHKSYLSKDVLDVIEHFSLCGSEIAKRFQTAVDTIVNGYNEYLSQIQKLYEGDISNLKNCVQFEDPDSVQQELHGEDRTSYESQRLRETIDNILSKNVQNEAEWHYLLVTIECNVLDVMKFVKRIKALWILYQNELAETKKTIIENVEKVKQACNKEEEELTKKLNILLDNQRKESTSETLDKTTQKISTLLNTIKERYEVYYEKEKEAIKQFLPLLMKKAPEIKTEIDLILEDFDKYGIKYSTILTSDFSVRLTDETPVLVDDCHHKEVCRSQINAANNWKLGLYERLEHFQEKCDCFLIKGAALWISSEINLLTKQLIKKMRLLEAERNKMIKTHNMRAAELCWHSNRLSAHIQGVRQVIGSLKQQVLQLKAKENEMKIQLEARIKDLNRTHAVSFCEAQQRVSQVDEEWTKMNKVLNQALVEQTAKCVETFQRLHDSNTNYLKAMKLFTAGGNFSQEEIKTVKAQLKNLDKEMKAEKNKLLKQCIPKSASAVQKETRKREEIVHRMKDSMKKIKLYELKKEYLDVLQSKLTKEINRMKQNGDDLHKIYDGVCKKCSNSEQWNNLLKAICNRCNYLLLPKGSRTLEMCSVQEAITTVNESLFRSTDVSTTVNEPLFRSTDVSTLSQNDNRFIAATKLLIVREMDFLRNMAQKFLNLQPSSQHTKQSGTKSKGKSMSKQKQPESDEFSDFMDLTINTLKMYNLYCEKQWLQQVQGFLEQLKDVYEMLDSFMDRLLMEQHNQCLIGIDLLVKTHQSCSSDFWDEAQRERNKMDRGLLPLHGHPHWKNRMTEMCDEAKNLVSIQLQTQKSILERYKNALQDSYRNYVTTLRPLVEMLTSLQERAFNEENTKTMFKQIKSILQKLKDPRINLHTQASLIDTITLEDVQGTPDFEPTTSNVTESKTNKLATLSIIINKIEEITGKLSFPQGNEIPEDTTRITLLSFNVEEKAFKNIKAIGKTVQECYNRAEVEHNVHSEKWKQWLHTWFHNVHQIKKLYVL